MEKQVYELKSKMRIRNICDDDWNKSGNSNRQRLIKNNRDGDFKVHHWQYSGEMEFYEDIRNIRETRDVTRWATTKRRAWRDHVNKMDGNRLAKISKNRKPDTWTVSETLVQKLDMNITEKQTK